MRTLREMTAHPHVRRAHRSCLLPAYCGGDHRGCDQCADAPQDSRGRQAEASLSECRLGVCVASQLDFVAELIGQDPVITLVELHDALEAAEGVGPAHQFYRRGRRRGRYRWKAFGQKSAHTSARGNIQHCVQDFAHLRRSRLISTLCRRNEWRHQRPLCIRHIRWISQFLPAMHASGNTGRCHNSRYLVAKGCE